MCTLFRERNNDGNNVFCLYVFGTNVHLRFGSWWISALFTISITRVANVHRAKRRADMGRARYV